MECKYGFLGQFLERRVVGCDGSLELLGTAIGTSRRWSPHTSDPGALVSAQLVQGLLSLVSRAWHRVKAAPVPRVSLELPWQAGEEVAKIYTVSTPARSCLQP